MQLLYTKTPIVEISTPETIEASIKLLIKREDQNHPFISGNKWWKLKYNLEAAQHQGYKTLLTFGGAYSNHIYATAAAAHELGLKSIGIIRGEETLPLNATLAFAKSRGMQLQYVSREAYRNKTEEAFIQNLHKKFGDFYLIPEGGTNSLAIKGVAEFAKQLNTEVDFDYLCLPAGTGGTMAGMIEGLDDSKQVVGFPVLKGAEFMEEEIKRYTTRKGWQLIYDYHFGGYAKTTDELNQLIAEMKDQYELTLEPVYTAKLVAGVFDLIRNGHFKSGTTVMMVHTGGLQSLAT